MLPLLPGTPERRTHDYVRHGTVDLYAALDLTTGMVTHQLTARHRAAEFKKFLDLIDKTVPAELKVHIVCDNSSTSTALPIIANESRNQDISGGRAGPPPGPLRAPAACWSGLSGRHSRSSCAMTSA